MAVARSCVPRGQRDMIAVGIDCTSGNQAFTYAAIDEELNVAGLGEVEMNDLAAFLSAHESANVAVNSPSHLNVGVVRKRLELRAGRTRAVRGAELREAELELRQRGIVVGGTPRSAALCPAWMAAGFEIYHLLEEQGYVPFPTPDAGLQWLETHPHAGFCILLGAQPMSKPSLEGRLQRALVLFEGGVRIQDPMGFFEEITRHRLLHGVLPMEQVPVQEELDALLAAYTAWLAWSRPDTVTRLGNQREGYITVPAAHLNDQY
jgi:hypothetical protein